MISKSHFIFLFSFISTMTYAQSEQATLLSINGDSISLSTIEFEDKLMIEFWAPGLNISDIKVNSIFEEYDKWIDLTGMKLILIVAEDPHNGIIRQARKHKWPFEIYFDPYHSFYQSLSGLPTKTT